MRILVTGQSGQVASCLRERSVNFPDLKISFAARTAADTHLDLTNESSIRSAVQTIKPDVIVNAAAYTAVDQAESEEEPAFRINGWAPGILAEEAAELGAKIIQISTDYVFDGTAEGSYEPGDAVNPISVYGKSKLAGEEAVAKQISDFAIIRTAWVYSPYGKNFLKTMLRVAESRDELSVVNDQFGNPTSAYEIADGILRVLNTWSTGKRTGLGEVFHLAGNQSESWFDFANRIFADSAELGGPSAKVLPIPSSAYPTPVKRPENSRLSSEKFRSLFPIPTNDYSDAPLSEVLEKLFDASQD